MLVKRIVTLLLLVLATMLTGCGGAHEAALTGVIGHPHSMTLPVGTVMTIQLIDRTVGGEAGKVIAEQVTQGRVIGIPTPFIVVYDQGKINADHVYFLAVRIEDSAGKLIYSGEKEAAVITQGNPTKDIDISVVLVDG